MCQLPIEEHARKATVEDHGHVARTGPVDLVLRPTGTAEEVLARTKLHRPHYEVVQAGHVRCRVDREPPGLDHVGRETIPNQSIRD